MSQVLHAAAGKAFQKLITPSSSHECPRCEVLYDTLVVCIIVMLLLKNGNQITHEPG